MKFDHDVIVIGGGPAGSSFARIAAAGGLDVLVVDKRKEIGIPVRCGEGLGRTEVVKEGLDIPKRCCSVEIEGSKVVAPNGKEIVWKNEKTRGWVLERKIFDKWLAELAVEKGAKVKTYTRATGLVTENGKPAGVKLSHGGRDGYEVTAPLIVSAEGMEALMAREMGFKTVHSLYDVDTCYQYEMKPYDHENLIELYFGAEIAPRGYVWIFPKCDRKANVGIGIGGNINNAKKCDGVDGADPKKLLDDFIAKDEQLKDASTLIDFGGVISVGAPIDSFVKDNCMVIGTGAKQVDPIHGGGIAVAMGCGVLAANAALEAHKSKDFSAKVLYGHYEKPWRATAGKKMEKRLMLRKVMERISDDDFNHCFDSLNSDDIAEIMKGNFAPSVAKVLAGRPQMLGALRGLM